MPNKTTKAFDTFISLIYEITLEKQTSSRITFTGKSSSDSMLLTFSYSVWSWVQMHSKECLYMFIWCYVYMLHFYVQHSCLSYCNFRWGDWCVRIDAFKIKKVTENERLLFMLWRLDQRKRVKRHETEFSN